MKLVRLRTIKVQGAIDRSLLSKRRLLAAGIAAFCLSWGQLPVNPALT